MSTAKERHLSSAEVEFLTGGNPEVAAKAKSVWSEALADPDAAPKLPLNPELFAFIEKAWKAGEADAA